MRRAALMGNFIPMEPALDQVRQELAVESHFTSVVSEAIHSGLGIDEVDARLKDIVEQMSSSP